MYGSPPICPPHSRAQATQNIFEQSNKIGLWEIMRRPSADGVMLNIEMA
jgi:hypothetical protein